jgi:hypothetical protein
MEDYWGEAMNPNKVSGSLLADIDAIRTVWRTTNESFYIPNYV